MLGGVHAQSGVQADHKGTDVEGGVLLRGNPVLLHLHQLHDAGHSQLLGNLGQAQTLGGLVHPVDVVLDAEQLDGAVGGAVGFQTLEDLLGVVEHLGSGVDLQGAVGNDAGIVPALALVIIHQEHMVGHIFSEHQLGGVGLLLQSSRTGDFDVFHGNSS